MFAVPGPCAVYANSDPVGDQLSAAIVGLLFGLLLYRTLD